MLTIQDLSKEVDMTAVRGGWSSCGDEDREWFDRDDRHHCERGDRDRDHERCERRYDASKPSLGLAGSFNLSSCGY